MACLIAVAALLKYSSLGRQIRATVQNRDLAETVGVSTKTIDRLTFFLGSGPGRHRGRRGHPASRRPSPTMGSEYIIWAFLVVVAGGIGQIKGAVIAAFGLGRHPRLPDLLHRREHGGRPDLLARRRLPPGAPAGPVRRTHQEPGMTVTTTDTIAPPPAPPRGHPSRESIAQAVPAPRRHRRAGRAAAGGGTRRADVFRLNNLGKYCCYAIAAVGIGLAWGRGGMLVLGQGLFFGLGAYAMAMHLKLEATGPDAVPDFMIIYGSGVLPAWWEPFRSGAVHDRRDRGRCRRSSPRCWGSRSSSGGSRAPTSRSCHRR